MPKTQLIRLGLVSLFGKATQGETLLRNLVGLLQVTTKELQIIAPDPSDIRNERVSSHSIKYRIGTNLISQIYNQVNVQIQMLWASIQSSGKVDAWMFYGGDVLALPILFAKFSGKPVLLLLAGNLVAETRLKKNALNGIQRLLRRLCLNTADRIILYSNLLISKWSLERFARKIIIADTHYVDTSLFKTYKPFDQRELKIGYVGRLSKEKGILNLLHALPPLLSNDLNLKVLIVGSGPLESEVLRWIETNQFAQRVTLYNGVPHERIPAILNELKICILPSYTEGLPNIILEAMACGTPVIATSVGAIPDVITHGEDGFILTDNDPKSIARMVCEALSNRGLSRVSEQARQHILDNYAFELVTDRYKDLFKSLQSDGL